MKFSWENFCCALCLKYLKQLHYTKLLFTLNMYGKFHGTPGNCKFSPANLSMFTIVFNVGISVSVVVLLSEGLGVHSVTSSCCSYWWQWAMPFTDHVLLVGAMLPPISQPPPRTLVCLVDNKVASTVELVLVEGSGQVNCIIMV